MPTGKCGGYTFIGVLFLLAGLGAILGAAGSVWSTAAQREKEKELLFIGGQFQRALDSWRETAPNQAAPKRLEELLRDPRFPHTVRHLRRVWRDPMTGAAEWGLERDAMGGIIGVFSLSGAAPLKKAGFPVAQAHFGEAASYRDWIFRAARQEVDSMQPDARGRRARPSAGG